MEGVQRNDSALELQSFLCHFFFTVQCRQKCRCFAAVGPFKCGLICANEFVCNRFNDCKVVHNYELQKCALVSVGCCLPPTDIARPVGHGRF